MGLAPLMVEDLRDHQSDRQTWHHHPADRAERPARTGKRSSRLRAEVRRDHADRRRETLFADPRVKGLSRRLIDGTVVAWATRCPRCMRGSYPLRDSRKQPPVQTGPYVPRPDRASQDTHAVPRAPAHRHRHFSSAGVVGRIFSFFSARTMCNSSSVRSVAKRKVWQQACVRPRCSLLPAPATGYCGEAIGQHVGRFELAMRLG